MGCELGGQVLLLTELEAREVCDYGVVHYHQPCIM